MLFGVFFVSRAYANLRGQMKVLFISFWGGLFVSFIHINYHYAPSNLLLKRSIHKNIEICKDYTSYEIIVIIFIKAFEFSTIYTIASF